MFVAWGFFCLIRFISAKKKTKVLYSFRKFVKLNYKDMMLQNDIITIRKKTGEIFKNVKADVQSSKVFISDGTLPIEEGDYIYRELPNGLTEEYKIINRGYYSAFGRVPAHYQASIRRTVELLNREDVKSLNVNGNNNTIIVDSPNTKIQIDNVFTEIAKELNKITDEDIKRISLEVLKEMENRKGTSSYKESYMKFISVLADHMTVITPFILPLSKFLVGK